MTLLYSIELFGVVVFAAAGAIEAARNRFDIFGVLVLAFVSALGGGTLRDVLLGISPLAWIADLTLAYLAVSSAIVTFIVAKFIRMPFRWLLYADAIGLAAFTVSGAQTAISMGLPTLIIIMMGVASGIFGGIIRDIIANETPLIFRSDIYATAAISGATVMSAGELVGLNSLILIVAGFAVTLCIRCAAIYWQLSLPAFLSTATYRKENHPRKL